MQNQNSQGQQQQEQQRQQQQEQQRQQQYQQNQQQQQVQEQQRQQQNQDQTKKDSEKFKQFLDNLKGFCDQFGNDQNQQDNNKTNSDSKTQSHMFRSNDGQLASKIQLENICTAIAFHPKYEEYIVVAIGGELHTYYLIRNRGSEVQEFKPIKFGHDYLNKEVITSILFSTQTTESQNEIFIGTRSGNFFVGKFNNQQSQIIEDSRNQEQQRNQGTNNQNQNRKVENYSILQRYEIHQSEISCILQYTHDQKQIILTSSYDGYIKQFYCYEKKTDEKNTNETDFYIIESISGEKLGESNFCLQFCPSEAVYWITLSDINPKNHTQTLVSSGYDSFIYVWQRKINKNEWKFCSKYKRNGIGSRVACFGYNFVVQQMFQQNCIKIFRNIFTEFKEIAQNINEKNIQQKKIQEDYESDQVIYDIDKFPLLYNSGEMIMAIKYKSKVYFLKYSGRVDNQEQFNFIVSKGYIECGLNCTEAAMSAKAKNIAIYNSTEKCVNVYKAPILSQS